MAVTDLGIKENVKYFFVHVIIFSVWLTSISSSSEFIFDNNITDNEMLIVQETTQLNFTFTLIPANPLNYLSVVTKVHSYKNGTKTNKCNVRKNCSLGMGNVECSCVSPSGPYLFTKSVTRDDNNMIYEWTAEDDALKVIAQRNITFIVTYPPHVTNLTVVNSTGRSPHLVLKNESFEIICSFDGGNPPRTPILFSTQGTPLTNLIVNSSHITGHHRNPHCHDVETVRCEVEGADRNLSLSVLVKCSPQFDGSDNKVQNGILGGNATFTFSIRAHTTQILKCHIAQITEQFITNASISEEACGAYIYDSNISLSKAGHEDCALSDDVYKNKCTCSLTGTLPNLTLELHFVNIEKQDEGRWYVNMSNEIGSDHCTFILQLSEGDDVPLTKIGILVAGTITVIVVITVTISFAVFKLKKTPQVGSSERTRKKKDKSTSDIDLTEEPNTMLSAVVKKNRNGLSILERTDLVVPGVCAYEHVADANFEEVFTRRPMEEEDISDTISNGSYYADINTAREEKEEYGIIWDT